MWAIGLALVPMAVTAFSISKIVGGYMDSMARNPEGDKSGDRRTLAIIGIAAAELMGLLSFVIAFMMLSIR